MHTELQSFAVNRSMHELALNHWLPPSSSGEHWEVASNTANECRQLSHGALLKTLPNPVYLSFILAVRTRGLK